MWASVITQEKVSNNVFVFDDTSASDFRRNEALFEYAAEAQELQASLQSAFALSGASRAQTTLHYVSVTILLLFELEFLVLFFAIGFKFCCRAWLLIDVVIVTVALIRTHGNTAPSSPSNLT